MAKTSENSRVVRLQLTCVTFPHHAFDPAVVKFGLQDRQQVLTLGQLQPDGSYRYEFEVEVIPQRETDKVRWRGPYVHGTSAVPFLYLSLRHYTFEQISWIKRLKIPLPHIAWEEIASSSDTPCLAASVSGNGSGTVPLLGEGWTRQHQAQV